MELYGTIMELFMVGKFGQPGNETIKKLQNNLQQHKSFKPVKSIVIIWTLCIFVSIVI